MQPGELVSGRFEIRDVAGKGGFGAVYRALDRQTGAPVAVKVLHGHGGDHAERFAREARLLSALQHPGIVAFVAHGTTAKGEGYLAMEWLEGESLSARLDRGPMPVSDALVLVSRVAEALRVAHDRGIVHRDLKPGNLFLVGGAPAQVKVLDFGIARVLEPGQTLTVTGAMLGTPGYMSPEQSRGEKDVDGRTDVFALGCVLFRCLTGRAAFEGTDALSVSLKVLQDPAPRVASLAPGVPAALDDLVDRMLAKARADRPPDAAALLAALNAIAAGAPLALPPRSAPISAVSAASAAPAGSGATRSPSRGPALLVAGLAGGLLVLASVVAVLVLVLPRTATEAPRPPAEAGPLPTSAYCPGEKCLTFRAADPSHVEATELLAQARQLATSVDRTAELYAVNLQTTNGDGTVDVTSSTQALSYNFQGKSGMMQVSRWGSLLLATHYGGQPGHAVTDPICSSKAAWKAAFPRGPQKSGSAMMTLNDSGPGFGLAWTIVVAGTSVRVDGHTCASRR